MSSHVTVMKSEDFVTAQIDRYDKKRNKSNDGNILHFSSVCSFRFIQEREYIIIIKYTFSDEIMEVDVKKRG
jgi:tRNA(His) 5'-end guanylyltransferase